MMQMSLFYICTLQFVFELYDSIILVKANFAYKAIVNISCIFLWSIRFILEIVSLNYVCEGLCMKVKTENSLEEL